MPVFKAVNVLTLLLPDQDGETNIVRKLNKVPLDFEDLPWIHERTDRKYAGHLEDQDTLILIIEIADHHEIYEITCRKQEDNIPELDILLINSGNN